MISQNQDKVLPRTKVLDKCPVCKSSNTTLSFSSTDRLHGTPGEYSYHKCGECQTVFQNPIVVQEDLHLCYAGDYYTHEKTGDEGVEADEMASQNAPQPDENWKAKFRQSIIGSVKGERQSGLWGLLGSVGSKSRTLRERAFFVKGVQNYYQPIDEMFPRDLKNRRGLEVGCGSGVLLSAMQEIGWEMEAIEWDGVAAENARRLVKCPVYVGSYKDIDLPESTYQVIVLNHVFEHLDDPVSALEKFSRLLAPGGRIVLIYPNANSIGAWYWKENWMPWETPRHLVFPTVSGLKKAMKKLENLRLKKAYSLSRATTHNFAYSRKYKTGQRESKKVDSMWHLLVKTLEALKLSYGEEIVVVLEKG